MVVLLGCSVTFGQSKKDISDFKEKYPKTKDNATAHINDVIGGMKSKKISKKIPFVKGNINERLHYIEDYNYRYTTSDYIDLSRAGRLYPFCIERSNHENETERKQKLYDKVIKDIPESIKYDATDYIPVGAKIDVWFVIFEGDTDKLNSLEIRTNPKRKSVNEPLRFRDLFDNCLSNERNKVAKIVKTTLKNGDGYVFAKVYIKKPDIIKKDIFGGFTKTTGKTETMLGWIRLSDLMIQKIFDEKK